MNFLIIGDIVGKPGREAAKKAIAQLKKEVVIDFVIANGENLAHGKGMTKKTFHEMREAGIDFFTSGNHIFHNPDIFPELEKKDPLILRPANFPPGNKGVGHRLLIFQKYKILIINLSGRVFMPQQYDCPFRTVEALLNDYKAKKPDIILIDLHAEVTSEKIALKHYLEGRVTALWGTHTHVPTADEEITPQGMAYITDLGMTGPSDSVIGGKIGPILEHFLLQTKLKVEVADGSCVFNSLMIEVEGRASKGLLRAKAVKRIQLKYSNL